MLTGGVARQDLEDPEGISEARHQFVDAQQGDMDPRQGGDQPGVALIGDQADGAGLGNREIGAGDAHVGLGELAAQFPPCDLDQFFDIRFLVGPGDVGKEVAYLIAGEMDRRHDHVRWSFMAELDDPLAEIGLGHFEPMVFEGMVEQRLLGGHRLRLDDFFEPVS